MKRAFSFEGYSILEWLRGNYKTIKELAKAVIPMVIAWTQTQNPALTGVITILGKLLLDGLEYFLKPRE